MKLFSLLTKSLLDFAHRCSFYKIYFCKVDLDTSKDAFAC